MSVEQKLDKIIEDARIYRKDLREEISKQGGILARLDERTAQHEKRMDRMQRKASGISAVVSTAVAFVWNAVMGGPSA